MTGIVIETLNQGTHSISVTFDLNKMSKAISRPSINHPIGCIQPCKLLKRKTPAAKRESYQLSEIPNFPKAPVKNEDPKFSFVKA